MIPEDYVKASMDEYFEPYCKKNESCTEEDE